MNRPLTAAELKLLHRMMDRVDHVRRSEATPPVDLAQVRAVAEATYAQQGIPVDSATLERALESAQQPDVAPVQLQAPVLRRWQQRLLERLHRLFPSHALQPTFTPISDLQARALARYESLSWERLSNGAPLSSRLLPYLAPLRGGFFAHQDPIMISWRQRVARMEQHKPRSDRDLDQLLAKALIRSLGLYRKAGWGAGIGGALAMFMLILSGTTFEYLSTIMTCFLVVLLYGVRLGAAVRCAGFLQARQALEAGQHTAAALETGLAVAGVLPNQGLTPIVRGSGGWRHAEQLARRHAFTRTWWQTQVEAAKAPLRECDVQFLADYDRIQDSHPTRNFWKAVKGLSSHLQQRKQDMQHNNKYK